MRWMLSGMVFFLLSTPAKAFCLFGPCSHEACIDKYVVPAQDETAAKLLAQTCDWEFRGDGFRSDRQEQLAKCYRDKLPNAQNRFSSLTARQLCDKETRPARTPEEIKQDEEEMRALQEKIRQVKEQTRKRLNEQSKECRDQGGEPFVSGSQFACFGLYFKKP